jgi:hypothetical protein
MPIHALAGQRLEVLGSRKDPDRGLYVIVQHPDGCGIALPLSWTDAGIADPALTFEGKVVRLDPCALLDLVHALASLEGEKLDRCRAGSTLRHTTASSTDPDGPAGKGKSRATIKRRATTAGGGPVRHARSQDDSVNAGGNR